MTAPTLYETPEFYERPVFRDGTLRLIVGALAFAFPSMVIALTGKVTTSISSSYYEPQTRSVFVGFLFIIGTLLVSYKGHRLALREGERGLGAWLKRYQEEWISSLGGLAALLTALNPTACDGCSMDTTAWLHTSGAFVLFASIVYFCLVAFLRSLNKKLIDANSDFTKVATAIRSVQSLRDVLSGRELGYLLLPEIFIFLGVADQIRRDYDAHGHEPMALLPGEMGVSSRFQYMWGVYGKKIPRGYVYLLSGLAIGLTLLSYLGLLVFAPASVDGSRITFLIETISLVFFGVAWMTASQMEYLRQIQDWLARRSKRPAVPQPDAL